MTKILLICFSYSSLDLFSFFLLLLPFFFGGGEREVTFQLDEIVH